MITSVVDLCYLAVLAVGAVSTGQVLLARFECTSENRFEAMCFSATAGLGLLVLLIQSLGLLHLLHPVAVWLAVAAWLILGIRGLPLLKALVQRGGLLILPLRSPHSWLILLAGAGLSLGLIRALAPPHGATDPLAYQLALPKLYLLSHHLGFERTITGALYPANMGLLYVVGIALRGGSLAQLLHWLLGALACLAVGAFGARHFGRSAGIWGAVIFSFTPIVVYFSPLGYVDVALCFFQFMAFWAVLNWAEAGGSRPLLFAAVLAGLAMGFKPQGLSSLFLAAPLVAVVATRRSGWQIGLRSTLAFVGIALLVVSPWYVRSFVYAGNPLWPLANDFFGGLPTGRAPSVLSFDAASGPAGSSPASIWDRLVGWVHLYRQSMSPWAWTFAALGSQKAIGIYFAALLPGVLLYARTRKDLLLAGFCIVFYFVLITALHMNPRYGLVLLAFASVLCGRIVSQFLLARWRWLSRLFLVAFVATAGLNIAASYYLALPALGVVSGRVPREAFRREHVGSYRAFAYINTHLPLSARVLFQGLVEGYYCDRDYLWGDHPHSGLIDYSQMKTPEQMLQRFSELGVTHVLRMVRLPGVRAQMYPRYFEEPLHEEFRKRFLKPLYYDESYVVFEIRWPDWLPGPSAASG